MTESIIPARVRFAPSPTGHMHLGSARTALYDYLLARQTGGQFILRIEDTDRKRFVPGAEQELIDGMRWLGLDWDEGPDVGGAYGPYHQSERREIYQEYARKLIDLDKAYFCFCTPERLDQVHKEQMQRKETPHYDGLCRHLDPDEAARRVAAGETHVIRFKTPKSGVTTVRDVLRGEISVENNLLDDYILVKSDGWALYHLAATIDDHLMQITHVLRGTEWLPTLPLHAMIHRALGWEEPVWVHLSVFLKPSGKGKMSKREAADLSKDGYSIFIKDLKDLGYIPEGVVNWVALMGWSFDDHTEFFKLKDLVDKFSIHHLNPSPAAINFSKLDYFNGEHIRSLSIADLANRIRPYLESSGLKTDDGILMKVAPIVQVRLATLDEVVEMAGFFFRDEIEQDAGRLVIKNLDAPQTVKTARELIQILTGQPDLAAQATEIAIQAYIDGKGLSKGQILGFLREAVTGQKVSPPLFETMEIVGKQKVLQRIEQAIRLLQ